MEISAFEREEIKRIEAIRSRKPERGSVKCLCCDDYFSSADRRMIRFCPGCKEHASNPRAFGCPKRLLEHGGVSLHRMKHDPSHYSNSHLFNARPKYPKLKDRRCKFEDIPDGEEIEGLLGEDLGVRICVDRDE